MPQSKTDGMRGTVMHLARKLLTPGNYVDWISELRMSLACRPLQGNLPSFPVDREQLCNLKIFWPERYEWSRAMDFCDPILNGLKCFARPKTEAIPQPYKGTVIFQLGWGGSRFDVAIDYSDDSKICDECASQCLLVFKLQHLEVGYRHANVIPGGYIPGSKSLYRFVGSLRKLRKRQAFDYDVYGRFNTKWSPDVRVPAVRLLSDQTAFRYYGGVTTIRYSRFLHEVARSKICVDLPGNGDFCFRLIDYLAIGACVIAWPHRTRLHVPLVDRTHVVYMREDLSDLVELCSYYIKNERAREEMSTQSRELFDNYLHQSQLGAYYIWCCLKALPET